MFYIATPTGTELQNGKRFETLQAAIAGAKTSMKRSIAKSEHGTIPFDVWEVIPGRHELRATINPNLDVTSP